MNDSTDTGLPADRIFLSNYVRTLEIGAYEDERGRTQRLRFDIALAVARVEHEDDYTRIANYEDLVAAVDAVAAGPRLNLVESFAERLAERCLADPRALSVRIRIEKLDRLPDGAGLGIEIVRARPRG